MYSWINTHTHFDTFTQTQEIQAHTTDSDATKQQQLQQVSDDNHYSSGCLEKVFVAYGRKG